MLQAREFHAQSLRSTLAKNPNITDIRVNVIGDELIATFRCKPEDWAFVYSVQSAHIYTFNISIVCRQLPDNEHVKHLQEALSNIGGLSTIKIVNDALVVITNPQLPTINLLLQYAARYGFAIRIQPS